MVTPIEVFHDVSGLCVAKTLIRDNDGNCWVRLLNVHIEDFVTYKICRVGILEAFKFELRDFSVQINLAADAK